MRQQRGKRELNLRKYRERLALVQQLKRGPCSDCSHCFDPVCMDFDHVRGVKLFAVADCGARNIESILNEIAKCDLVCANCHRLRSQRRRKE